MTQLFLANEKDDKRQIKNEIISRKYKPNIIVYIICIDLLAYLLTYILIYLLIYD